MLEISSAIRACQFAVTADGETVHPVADRIFDGGVVPPVEPMKGRKMNFQDFPMYAYIPAKDLARARQFYETKLGLKPKQVRDVGVIYEFGKGTGCFLYVTSNAGTSKASQAFWMVDDVDRTIEALKARGVVFEDYDMPGEKSPAGATTADDAKAAWFKDSEGNIMALIQPL